MAFVGEHLRESDFRRGGEAYIRYCSGLAIVQYPDDMVGIHNRPEVEESIDEILMTAEATMLNSIQRIIRLSVPGEPRTVEAARGRFSETEPGMNEIVEWACMMHEGRLNKLNEHYATLRPAPFLNQTIYSYICHANYDKLSTLDLMDIFVPDLRFMDALQGRHIKSSA